MKAPFNWEFIDNSSNHETYRAMVEGGWLVNHIYLPCDQESLATMTTTFVPDPQHNWIIEQANPSVQTIKEWPLHVGEAINAGNPGAQDFEAANSKCNVPQCNSNF